MHILRKPRVNPNTKNGIASKTREKNDAIIGVGANGIRLSPHGEYHSSKMLWLK